MTVQTRSSSKVSKDGRRILELGNRPDALAFITKGQSKLFELQRKATGTAAATTLGKLLHFLIVVLKKY